MKLGLHALILDLVFIRYTTKIKSTVYYGTHCGQDNFYSWYIVNRNFLVDAKDIR